MELGCNDMPSKLVACGSEDSAHDRLGNATRLLGGIAELADERDVLDGCVDMMCSSIRAVVVVLEWNACCRRATGQMLAEKGEKYTSLGK